ncbi:MAG: response regulator transcription factor [Thermoleophilia bacterium]|nr:response regulator transcription factor [Thermoleophilia bacterium]
MSIGLGSVVPSVLLVEDDGPTRVFLSENLIADRFAPVSATSAEEAIEMLATARPDAAVVDVGLPGMSGLELVSRIREGGADAQWDAGLPILLISADAGPFAVVRGIDRGADDFVAKPFHYPEVLARLGSMIRRSRGATVREEIRVGSLAIDRHSRRASLGGRVIDLSAKEFALLAALAKDPTRVLTKGELLRDVWGYRAAARTRTVDSHASRLRRKLAAQGGGERWVVNVWGIGYRLLPEEA